MLCATQAPRSSSYQPNPFVSSRNLLAQYQRIEGQEVAGLLRVWVLLNAAKSCQVQRTSRGLVYVNQQLGSARKQSKNLSSNYEPGGREFESLRARQ
jgi:hypothetical protein